MVWLSQLYILIGWTSDDRHTVRQAASGRPAGSRQNGRSGSFALGDFVGDRLKAVQGRFVAICHEVDVAIGSNRNIPDSSDFVMQKSLFHRYRAIRHLQADELLA